MGLRFGDAAAPLLVSVRSGAAVSMPGMMDTVLNLGLNDATTVGPRRADTATRASRGTATGASSRCTPTS
jgi:pyruvate,orthophosphate dikinase